MIKKTLTIHSGLFEALGNAGKFYYYLRYLDVNGSGYADVELYKTMNDLNLARATFYKYLKNKVFIREVVQTKPRTFRVFYASAVKLITNFIMDEVIDDLGVALDVYLEELEDWRELITLGQAITLQTQSIHAALKSAKEKGKGKVPIISIPEIFEGKKQILDFNEKRKNRKNKRKKNKSASDSGLPSYMNILNPSLILKKVYDKQRILLYFDSNIYSPIGGSQDTIALRMGRSIRTIQRRLKNVDKVQQCFTNPNLTQEYKMECFIEGEDWITYTKKYFEIALIRNPDAPYDAKNELFQSYTNLYNPNQVDIKGVKYLRQKIRSRLIWIKTNLPENFILTPDLSNKITEYQEKQSDLANKGKELIPFVEKDNYSSPLFEKYQKFLEEKSSINNIIEKIPL